MALRWFRGSIRADHPNASEEQLESEGGACLQSYPVPRAAGWWGGGKNECASSDDNVNNVVRRKSVGIGLFGQPANFDEAFDGFQLRIAGQNGCVHALGGRHAECIGIGERMFAFDFCGCLDQRLVHRKEVDGELFEETERVHRLGWAHASLDDIVELAQLIQLRTARVRAFSWS
jgi:hypothetical protein